ncbi:Hypothetical protein CINCED_3A019773 [Cinara cedri]|uniref:Transposase, type 1 n=1 Tax=Cinara cedri TaxID=506608 RepID=A0A5E4N324_9HEMI|nr:Hypothetical protein CINCED_3A019773 [Cinara cedri]
MTQTHTGHVKLIFKRFGELMWVRYGLVGRKLIGPFFYDGTLNGRQYLNFLTNVLSRLLDDVSFDTQNRNRMFFQQDGEPAHNAILLDDI